MSRTPRAFVIIENTTTRHRYRLNANEGGHFLPQGSYKVIRCTRTPKHYHFSGLFNRLTRNEENEQVNEFVLKTGVQHYAPFNLEDPQWVVVGSRAPDGEPPIFVELHRNSQNDIVTN